MVRKSNRSIQVCVEYMELNECNMKYVFELPRIDDLLNTVCNAKRMTHLDLRPNQNQVCMSDDGPIDDYIAATAFQGLTPNEESCLLEILVLWFSLCNATFPDL